MRISKLLQAEPVEIFEIYCDDCDSKFGKVSCAGCEKDLCNICASPMNHLYGDYLGEGYMSLCSECKDIYKPFSDESVEIMSEARRKCQIVHEEWLKKCKENRERR